MTAPRPAVYTIAAGVPFVDALAAGLLARHGAGPLGLSDVTVLLPNRRAARALRDAFLRQGGGRPMLLPSLRSLGDVDEDELALSGADLLELPPAIAALRRQLLLTRLVLRRPGGDDPAQAARLAAELAGLLDQVQIEGLDFARLQDLVPAEFAAHWQLTLEFLQIVTRAWPLVLAAEAAIDPAARRNMLLDAQAKRWQAAPPETPIYVAGSTGSIPAAAALMQVIANLPHGALVLPGFDPGLDAASWAALDSDPSHPQYGMKLLLTQLGVAREAVADWPLPAAFSGNPARAALLREALRPASTSEAWVGGRIEPAAIAGLGLLEAPGAQEEAAAIALLLRQALETPGRTAALVTADRGLARRVAVELARFAIEIDDSAGVPLAQTPPGALLRLTAEMLAQDLAPVPLLAALKHPLAAGGQPRLRFRQHVRRLEHVVLRGPRPVPGFDGLQAAVQDHPDSEDLARFVTGLAAAAAPFAALMAGGPVRPAALLDAHVRFAEWLALEEETGPQLWAGAAGAAAADFVHDLAAAAADMEPIRPAAWASLLEALMAGQVVRRAYGTHPRLAIWGPLEARLQQADLLVLGGLNEGSWPPDPGVDPWLSRPMRTRFGLPPPERRIGLAAHDFQQAAAAPDVMLSRALKQDGTPTVPSRWLLRLETVLKGAGLALDRRRGQTLLAWQQALDRPARVQPAPPPAPRPPLETRPRQLSVTAVETWIRDPYSIYARRVLRLRALEPLDAAPDAADRGTVIHQALDRFVQDYPEQLPADARQALEQIGRAAFGATLRWPGVRAFWWPRFLRIADWFLVFEAARRAGGARTLATERRGRLLLAGPAGPFELTAEADRIDRLPAGGLEILDYKTGQPPSSKQVQSGFAPQLPLEAAIAEAGGFDGIAAAGVSSLAYVRLSGGATPGEFKPVQGDSDAATLAQAARDGLGRLIAAFDDPATPYRSRPRPQFLFSRIGDYDHLARLQEWSAGGAEGDE